MIFKIFFIVILPINVYAQLFSGVVTYKDSYTSKNNNISSSDLENFIGSKRELYLSGSFYKIIRYGEVKSTMLYRQDENRVYNFKDGMDTIFWMNTPGDTLSKVLSCKMEDSDEIVLGLKCKKAI